MAMPTLTGYERHLIRRVTGCQAGGTEAALALFERREPETLREAMQLLQSEALLSPQASEEALKAWDLHWQLRGRPEA